MQPPKVRKTPQKHSQHSKIERAKYFWRQHQPAGIIGSIITSTLREKELCIQPPTSVSGIISIDSIKWKTRLVNPILQSHIRERKTLFYTDNHWYNNRLYKSTTFSGAFLPRRTPSSWRSLWPQPKISHAKARRRKGKKLPQRAPRTQRN